jgi:hypothetical protein
MLALDSSHHLNRVMTADIPENVRQVLVVAKTREQAFGRHAYSDGIRRNKVVDQSHSSDDRTLADLSTRQDHGICTDPDSILDDDFLPVRPGESILGKRPFGVAVVMIASNELAKGPKHDIVADPYRAELIRIEVAMGAGEEILADLEQFRLEKFRRITQPEAMSGML